MHSQCPLVACPSDNFKQVKFKFRKVLWRHPPIESNFMRVKLFIKRFWYRSTYEYDYVLLKAMLHGAICLATCNAILLLRDVKLPNTSLHYTPLMFSQHIENS
jgi:hypothetical protein